MKTVLVYGEPKEVIEEVNMEEMPPMFRMLFTGIVFFRDGNRTGAYFTARHGKNNFVTFIEADQREAFLRGLS